MIEVDKEIMNRLLDSEHTNRVDEITQLSTYFGSVNDDSRVNDLVRRLAREDLRYERAKSALRAYNLSVEEWEDEEGIDDPSKYHHWRNYI